MTDHYITARGGGGGRRYKIHTDRDCPHVKRAQEVREATDGEVEWFDECETCYGEPDKSSRDYSYYEAALEADPEDL